MKRTHAIRYIMSLAMLLCLLLPANILAQADKQSPNLSERVTVLEQRQTDLKERLEEKQADLKEDVEERLNSEQNTLNTSFIIAGFLIAILGIALPLYIMFSLKKQIKEETDDVKVIKNDARAYIEDVRKKLKEAEDCITELKKYKEAAEKDRLAIQATREATEKATQSLSEIMKDITLGNFNSEQAKQIVNNEEVEPFAHEWARILLIYFDDKKKDNTTFQAVIDRFQKLLDKYPEKINFKYLADIYFAMGYCYGELDKTKLQQSYDYFNAATLLNPRLAGAWYNKGNALSALGRYIEAIECYDKAIEINPKYAGAWHNKGVALENKGSEFYKAAKECYEEAKNLLPNNEIIKSNLANLQAKIDNENQNNTQQST